MLTLALAQLNATVGDLEGNSRAIERAARDAHARGAQVVLAPELVLTGYPPEDLLMRPAFMQACERALHALAASLADLPDLRVVVGHPMQREDDGDTRSRSLSLPMAFNAASVLQAGRVCGTYFKRELPNTRSSMSAATSRPAEMRGRARSCSRRVA